MADFLENYRQTIGGIPYISFGSGTSGRDTQTNPIVFRDAEEGEKTGRQMIVLRDKNGQQVPFYLVVPEKETVGYGNIAGWGDKNSQNMKTTKSLGGRGSNIFTMLMAPAVDILGRNTIENNAAKQELSEYTGEDKAVGLGNEGQSEGQILGMVDRNGNTYNAKSTQDFLQNLNKNGYIGLESFDTPTRVQEHNGPAYVPGDILLGLLGLRPNRGAVGYVFGEAKNNKNYNRFIDNIRAYGRADRGGQ